MEVEVVVLVSELVVVESINGTSVVSNDGVGRLVEGPQSSAELLDVAVSCVVVKTAVLLQSLK